MKNDGPWELDPSTMVLTMPAMQYDVDLGEYATSAETLDWIIQVAGKAWATDHVLASFVRAIEEQLSPQANLCGDGKEAGPVMWKVENGRMTATKAPA